MTIHLLLGEAEAGYYCVNAGSHVFEEYIIDVPEGGGALEDVVVNAENCSIAFNNAVGAKTINHLTIRSISNVTFNGGAIVKTLTVQAKEINFNCAAETIENVTVEDYDHKDYNVLRAKLQGICWTPGSGSAFASESTFAAKSLAELTSQLPAVKWVAPIVTWAASSSNIKDCKLYPGIENMSQASMWTAPSEPSVADATPYFVAPKLISRETAGSINPNFGRTYSDAEVVAAFDLAHSNNYRTCFIPSILVDQHGKPWRGFIKGDYSEVDRFFHEQYEPFILHYVHLLKGKTDAFMIGSELMGLTAIHTAGHKYPFVENLIKLASKVKTILGEGVKVSYGANWFEYHHVDGGDRPLDSLWASPAIDVVSMSAYFPLTDKKTSDISSAEIKAGWEKGEGYDFYTDGAGKWQPLPADWACKNLVHWWNTLHHNAKGVKTDWLPRMKKIWFTEFGCAAIDKGTNEPYTYYSPYSSDSKLPKHSTGQVSNDHMLKYFAGSLDFLSEHKDMVELAFAWCWDARSNGWHKDIAKWSDGSSWFYSHSLEGKLPTMESAVVISGNLKVKNLSVNQMRIKILSESASSFTIEDFRTRGVVPEVVGIFLPEKATYGVA